jgi:Cu-processing system permease protein
MNTVAVIALKEIREGLRNRWVVAATLLLGVLALALALVGTAPTGSVEATRLEVTVVGLSSLGIFLVPLIALLLSYEAIVGEFERGTMLLLLAYPVARWQIVLGKFTGHVAILAFATIVGFGIAALAVGLGPGGSAESWRAFAAMTGSTVLLGAAFIALGYLVSAAVRDRGTAAGLAVAVWLVFVVLYDLALLGALAADESHWIGPDLFRALMLINPADAYRIFNLSGDGNVALMSGMAGLGRQAAFNAALPLAVLAAWIVVPLAAAGALLERKDA